MPEPERLTRWAKGHGADPQELLDLAAKGKLTVWVFLDVQGELLALSRPIEGTESTWEQLERELGLEPNPEASAAIGYAARIADNPLGAAGGTWCQVPPDVCKLLANAETAKVRHLPYADDPEQLAVFSESRTLHRTDLWIDPDEAGELFAEQAGLREPLPDNALLKLQTPQGMAKLRSLFADLEQQGMVAEGTAARLHDHLTESALREAVPEGAPPIVWRTRKYELVHLLRTLRGISWLDFADKDIPKHFQHESSPVKMAGYAVKPTDDLSSIEAILRPHAVK